jgi:hypothetical protein
VELPVGLRDVWWLRRGCCDLQGLSPGTVRLPNDEAQPGHPLYPAGGWSYGFYEVLGSDWAARLRAQNRVVFPDWTPSDKRHFLVACHEDLVEVLADDVDVEVSQRPFEAVALEALRQNLRDHRV